MGLLDDYSAVNKNQNSFLNIKKRQRIYFIWFLIIVLFSLFCAGIFYDNRIFLKRYYRETFIIFLAGLINFTGLILIYAKRKKILKEKCGYCFAYSYYKEPACAFCGKYLTVKESATPLLFKIFTAFAAVIIFVSSLWWYLRWFSVYSIDSLTPLFRSRITLEAPLIAIMWFIAALLFLYLFLCFKSKKYVYFILIAVAAVSFFIYNDYAQNKQEFRINSLKNYSLKTADNFKGYVEELILKEKKVL